MITVSITPGKGSFPYHQGNHLIMELFVFADESGIHENPDYCIVAGFISNPAWWIRLDRKWRKALNDFQVQVFHSKEYFHRQGDGNHPKSPYNGWSVKKAARFLARLVSIISEEFVYPVGAMVDVKAFNALSYGEKRHLTGGITDGKGRWVTSGAPSQPYYLAMQGLLHESVTETVKVGSDAIGNFMFDRQNVVEAGATQLYYLLKTVLKDAHPHSGVLGGITFNDKSRFPGLQAADLLVYLWYGYLTRGATDMGIERALAFKVLLERRNNLTFIGADVIETILASTFNDEERQLLRSTPEPTQPKRIKKGRPG